MSKKAGAVPRQPNFEFTTLNKKLDTIIKHFKQPRHLFQLIILLVTLAIGLQFFLYVRQAGGTGAITIQRPPGVEGFLPIGALMGWKQLLTTGRWDMIHPAAMVIFGWAIALSFLVRKAFCGWFCPIGTLSEWLWRMGKRLFRKNFILPVWLDLPLRATKYTLLCFFIWVILQMSSNQITAFMHSPYYALSDVKMLHFFTRMSLLTTVILSGLSIFSMVFKNFWCRYLCPYGALLGIFAIISPTRVYRSAADCIDCGRCDRACPAHLTVSQKRSIKSPECIGCMDCVGACPQPGTLTLSSKGLDRSFWSTAKLAFFIGLFFLLTVYGAALTGHWKSGVSDMQFRVRLQSIDAPDNTHPSIDFDHEKKIR